MHRINPRKILYAALGVAVAMMTLPLAGAVTGPGGPVAAWSEQASFESEFVKASADALDKLGLSSHVYAADMDPMRDSINKADQAIAFAVGNLDMSPGDGGYAVSVGAGVFEDESAFAAGIAFQVADNFMIQGTAAMTSDEDSGAGVSLNWKF